MNVQLPKGVRPRGKKWFVDVTVGGVRKTATVDTYEEALATKSALIDALRNGKPIEQVRSNAAVWTLQQAYDKTASLKPRDGWRGSKGERKSLINGQAAIEYFGANKPVNEIDLEAIEGYFRYLETEKRNADSTINRKRSALMKMLKVATNYGGLAYLPKFPSQLAEPKTRIRQITAKEEADLIGYFRHVGRDDVADFVSVLIYTGMRVSEARNLQPQDVQLSDNTVLVYGTESSGTKNGTWRSVPLTTQSRAALVDWLEGQRVFNLTEGEFRHQWDNARRWMGLMDDPHFIPHVCRHTCASRLVRAEVSLPIVQKWMGHRDIKTTMRYAHLMPTDLFGAAKRLESFAG